MHASRRWGTLTAGLLAWVLVAGCSNDRPSSARAVQSKGQPSVIGGAQSVSSLEYVVARPYGPRVLHNGNEFVITRFLERQSYAARYSGVHFSTVADAGPASPLQIYSPRIAADAGSIRSTLTPLGSGYLLASNLFSGDHALGYQRLRADLTPRDAQPLSFGGEQGWVMATASDGADRAVVAWYAAGSDLHYAAVVDADGSSTVPINLGLSNHQIADAVWSGTHFLTATFSGTDAVVQAIQSSGVVFGSPSLLGTTINWPYVSLAASPGEVMAFTGPHRVGTEEELHATRLDHEGVPVGGPSVVRTLNSFPAALASDWNGESYLVAWEESDTVYFTLVGLTGTTAFASPSVLGTGTVEDVSCNRSTGVCLVLGPDKRVDQDGTILDSASLETSMFATGQFRPRVVAVAEGAVVVWEENRNSGHDTNDNDIAAAWLGPEGQPLPDTSWLPAEAIGAQSSLAIASRGDSALIVWSDSRDATSGAQLYGAVVSGDAPAPEGTPFENVLGEVGSVAVAAGPSSYYVAYSEPNSELLIGAVVGDDGSTFLEGPEVISRSRFLRDLDALWHADRYLILSTTSTSNQFVVRMQQTVGESVTAEPPVVFGSGPGYASDVGAASNGEVMLAAWVVSEGPSTSLQMSRLNGAEVEDLLFFEASAPAGFMFERSGPSVHWDGARFLVFAHVLDSAADPAERQLVVLAVAATGEVGEVEFITSGLEDEAHPNSARLAGGSTVLVHQRFSLRGDHVNSRVQTRTVRIGYAQGEPCDRAVSCQSGHCVEGVCCDSGCGGLCTSCLDSRTGLGADGVCGSVLHGLLPRQGTSCPDTGEACGPDGTCDGLGACRGRKPEGAECAPAECNGGSRVSYACDEAGDCIAADLSCGGYSCSEGVCLSLCAQDTDCLGSAFCQNGECVPVRTNGEACERAAHCDSGFCADGVCCDTACEGACVSCSGSVNVAGQDGKCSPTVSGEDPRDACEAGVGCESDGLCDGAGNCRAFAPAGTSCGEPACEGSSPVRPLCDGAGQCATQTSSSCSPYACKGSGVCTSTCSVDADCTVGGTCSEKGECVLARRGCKDDWTVEMQDGSRVSCGGYRCSNGICRDACSAASDCDAERGFRCTDAGTCLDFAAAVSGAEGESDDGDGETSQESGCGCKQAGGGLGSNNGSTAALLLPLILLYRRRRLSVPGAGALLVLLGLLSLGCSEKRPEATARKTEALTMGSAVIVSATQPLAANGQYDGRPDLATGALGVLAVWEDARSGERGIFATLLDETGAPVSMTGNRIASSERRSVDPKVAYKSGRFLVVWVEQGLFGDTVEGRFLDESGVPIGTQFTVVDTANGQTGVDVVAHDTGFVVGWLEWQSGPRPAYGRFIDADGTMASPVRVTEEACTELVMASGDAGVLFLVNGSDAGDANATGRFWTGAGVLSRTESLSLSGLYGMSADCLGEVCLIVGSTPGNHADPDSIAGLLTDFESRWDALAISTSAKGLAPQTQATGSGFFVSWFQGPDIPFWNGTELGHLHAARVDAVSGTVLDPEGVRVDGGIGSTEFFLGAALAFHEEQVVAVWGTGPTDNTLNTALFDPTVAPGIASSQALALSPPHARSVSLVTMPTGVAAGWSEDRSLFSGNDELHVVRKAVSSDGVHWEPSDSSYEGGAQLIASSENRILQLWYAESEVHSQFSDAAGTPLPGLSDGAVASLYGHRLLSVTGGGEAFLVLSLDPEGRGVLTRFTEDGAQLDALPIALPFTRALPFTQFGTAFDGTQFLVIFQGEPADASSSYDLYGCYVPPSGVPGAPFVVRRSVGYHWNPQVACLSDGRCLVAWRDEGSGMRDLAYSVVDSGVASPVAFPVRDVFQFSNILREVAVSADGAGFLLAYREEYLGANARLLGFFIDTDGRLENDEPVVLVDDAERPASPALAGLSEGRFVLGYTAFSGAPDNGAYFYARSISGAHTGSRCTTGGECGSGHCVDGVCCNNACGDGATDDCLSCALPGDVGWCGVDTGLPECVPAEGPAPQPDGAPCAEGGECISGSCVEGVCCDSPCEAPCSSCQRARTGAATGSCMPIVNRLPPKLDGACLQAANTCGADGLCDGTGSCRPFAEAGIGCGAPACDGNGDVAISECDGGGQCVSRVMQCAPFTCALGDCAEPCAGDIDCAGGYVCLDGGCIRKRTTGEACQRAGQCDSGHCVDGVCCNEACEGPCNTCSGAANLTGANGQCGPAKPGLDPRSGCLESTRECGAPGYCDGTGLCVMAAELGTECGERACSGSSVVTNQCDGAGACVPSESRSCEEYGCDSERADCRTSCSARADCSAGAVCNDETEECVRVEGTCSPDGAAVEAADGTRFSCGGYICSAGVCRDSCSAASDCVREFLCRGGACVAIGAAAANESADDAPDSEKILGCGCHLPGNDPAPTRLSLIGWFAVLLFAGRVARRRAA